MAIPVHKINSLSRSVGERIQKLCDCIAEMMREFPGAGTESCSPLARAALSCGWDLEYTSTTVRAMLLYMGINWLGMYLSLVERLGTYLSLVERLGTYLSLVERFFQIVGLLVKFPACNCMCMCVCVYMCMYISVVVIAIGNCS